jgi:acylphosphatase
MKTVRARISGRVQGVWYRGWTVETAHRLGLEGWVRNRADGSVEALFHGAEGAVNAMLELCRQGPPAARVDRLDVETAPPPEGGGFRQGPTF